MNSKKGLSVIMSVVMMVLVASVAGSALFIWFQSFQTEFQTKQQLEGDQRDLEILGIQYINTREALLGVKNNGPSYQIVDKIEVNGLDCEVVGSNVVDTIANVFVRCPTILDENYAVEVFSDEGISTRTFTSFELGETFLENFAPSNLTVTFRNALICQPWETKLYAMSFISRAHAEVPTQSNYAYSVCLNHSIYGLGTSCEDQMGVGDSQKVFDLGALTNSHVYVDNTTAAPRAGYYNWEPICLSAVGSPTINISVQASSSSPGSQYKCVGSIVGSDFTGYSVGDCGTYSTRMWVRVE